eukprot:TRINITY_DN647362_c0_g1_i1.p1 TRINITY_DN647362_c0_g1~~TRINITY_DN647362_c0_g1_i1.p1  ORF type:complete len:712 (-),score=232.99 TRINITY_DN647362_c0_g1_i1:301-2436(-)
MGLCSSKKRYMLGVSPITYFRDTILPKNKEMLSKLNITERQAQTLFQVFVEIDKAGTGELKFDDFAKFFKQPRSPYFDRVLGIIDLDAGGTLDFEEFCIGVWNYCTFNNTQLNKFCFDLFDVDKRGWISMSELDSLLRMMYNTTHATGEQKKILQMLASQRGGGGKVAPAVIDLNAEPDDDSDDEEPEEKFTLDEFVKINKKFKKLMKPAFHLQNILQSRTLGGLWKKKMKWRIANFGEEKDIFTILEEDQVEEKPKLKKKKSKRKKKTNKKGNNNNKEGKEEENGKEGNKEEESESEVSEEEEEEEEAMEEPNSPFNEFKASLQREEAILLEMETTEARDRSQLETKRTEAMERYTKYYNCTDLAEREEEMEQLEVLVRGPLETWVKSINARWKQEREVNILKAEMDAKDVTVVKLKMKEGKKRVLHLARVELAENQREERKKELEEEKAKGISFASKLRKRKRELLRQQSENANAEENVPKAQFNAKKKDFLDDFSEEQKSKAIANAKIEYEEENIEKAIEEANARLDIAEQVLNDEIDRTKAECKMYYWPNEIPEDVLWERLLDDEGNLYYYCHKTGVALYEKPLPGQEDPDYEMLKQFNKYKTKEESEEEDSEEDSSDDDSVVLAEPEAKVPILNQIKMLDEYLGKEFTPALAKIDPLQHKPLLNEDSSDNNSSRPSSSRPGTGKRRAKKETKNRKRFRTGDVRAAL